jgi:hypothetical protein
MVATLQLTFHITCNLAKLSLCPYIFVKIAEADHIPINFWKNK